jgi:hypothetical protein
MHTMVNGVRLFFGVAGEKVVAEGPRMRERPTLLLLHGGPGFDHSMFKPSFAPLAEVAQLIYLDHRGNGRSEHGDPPSASRSRLCSAIHSAASLRSPTQRVILIIPRSLCFTAPPRCWTMRGCWTHSRRLVVPRCARSRRRILPIAHPRTRRRSAQPVSRCTIRNLAIPI